MSVLEPYYKGIARHALPPIPRQPIHVVVDNLRSAYNVGSFFRTADGAAVEHVYLCGMSAHPPHKKLEKTALGAFEYVPWSYHERTSDVLDHLGEQGIVRAAVEVTEGSRSVYEYAWPRPVAVVFGNEVTGINERILGRCDAAVRIPMMGHKNTINVATAFGIVLYAVLDSWEAV